MSDNECQHGSGFNEEALLKSGRRAVLHDLLEYRRTLKRLDLVEDSKIVARGSVGVR